METIEASTTEAVGGILSRLTNIRVTGQGQWSAKCPAHEDGKNSLCISAGDDGRALVHCQAGCATTDIMAAINMEMKELFSPRNGHATNGHVVNGNGHAKPRFNIVQSYPYKDEAGTLLYEVCRGDPKDFRQRKPKIGGGYDWKLGEVRRVLYRLPELMAAVESHPSESPTVFVCEGEKDVDRLRSLGLTAVCNAGGASASKNGRSKWLKEYNAALTGCHVVVLPDNDEPGKAHAAAIVESVGPVAASVKILELPELPEKGDVSDWLDGGGTVDELTELAELTPTIAATPKRKREPRPKPIVGEIHSVDLKQESGRTDRANAQRLAARFGDSLRWCEPWGKWLWWDGKRWKADNERKADCAAKEVSDEVWQEVAKILPDVGGDVSIELVRFAKATASARGIQNMLALTRSEPGIAVLPEQLDSDPYLFNCRNGVIDLKTATLKPHDRKLLLTKLSPIEFPESAEGDWCPIWEESLEKILGDDPEVVRFVRRLLGSAMVGEVIEHILPIWHGIGSNGKSLVTETCIEAFGEYGDKASSDLLLVKQGTAHPTEKADLHGKRLVFAVETDDGRRLSEALAKELTGGDTIKARRMREDFWSFKPSHTVVLVTNHKPRVKGTDHGIWRRLRLVPFNQKFWDASRGESGPPELQADKKLKAKLQAEMPGILRWLAHACVEWQREGLGQPEAIAAATAEYRAKEDILGAFVEECCYVADNCECSAADVRIKYEEWCKSNGDKPVSGRRLGEYLTDQGVGRRKSHGSVVYTGLALT